MDKGIIKKKKKVLHTFTDFFHKDKFTSKLEIGHLNLIWNYFGVGEFHSNNAFTWDMSR